jgi:hypothetical protein
MPVTRCVLSVCARLLCLFQAFAYRFGATDFPTQQIPEHKQSGTDHYANNSIHSGLSSHALTDGPIITPIRERE